MRSTIKLQQYQTAKLLNSHWSKCGLYIIKLFQRRLKPRQVFVSPKWGILYSGVYFDMLKNNH